VHAAVTGERSRDRSARDERTIPLRASGRPRSPSVSHGQAPQRQPLIAPRGDSPYGVVDTLSSEPKILKTPQ
jgi:hypothetical protein